MFDLFENFGWIGIILLSVLLLMGGGALVLSGLDDLTGVAKTQLEQAKNKVNNGIDEAQKAIDEQAKLGGYEAPVK